MKHRHVNGSALLALSLLLACSNREPGGADPVANGDFLPVSAAPQTTSRTLALSSARVAISSPASDALADVSLPRLANGAAVVRDRSTGSSLSFVLEGARPAKGVANTGVVTYAGGGPSGSDVVHVLGGAGTEDFVVFETRPEAEAIGYTVDVGGAAGLRLVSNTLELLDASGTPRLRMNPPYALDRRGARHEARVTLSGCAADTDPRGPWRRPVTPPGGSLCGVRVTFGGEVALDYPVVVDPSWTATKGAMTSPRTHHTATLLDDGKVLVTGGVSGTGTGKVLQSAELFDPATNTFAATGKMTSARSEHVAVKLDSGDVLVALGANDAGAIAGGELYRAATGDFATAGLSDTARRGARAALLPDKTVILAGGFTTSGSASDATSLWVPTTGGFRDTGRLQTARYDLALGVRVTGAIIVGGGVSAAEIYGSGAWSSLGRLSSVRPGLEGAVLSASDHRFLVTGGYDVDTKAASDVAQYIGNATTWSTPVKMATARTGHTVTALPGGHALVAGGRGASDATTPLASVELYDGESDAFVAAPPLAHARFDHTATLLDDGRVLVAGGTGAAAVESSAELYTPSAQGAACKSAAECGTGFCVDGACCESACDDPCQGCSQATTGKADGTCADAVSGKDPHSDCTDDGAVTCGKNGLCDGKGACASYPAKPCAASACAEDTDCTSGHCVDGVCCNEACDGECEACVEAKTGGSDGTCAPVTAGKDPDAECGTLGTGVCRGTGTCDGKGACKVTTAGKACKGAECSDSVTLAAASTCSAAGECKAETTSCDPYVCDAKAVACKKTCASDDDCADGALCNGDACERKPNGDTCKEAKECTSGFCADGLCCDKACDGQCEACNGSGNEGECQPVTGDPQGDRDPCDGDAPCRGTCNGIVGNACVYPGTTVSCGDATCSDGTESKDVCNALGACSKGVTRDCAPYGCGDGACKASCTSDDDCASGYTCDADGRCGQTATGQCPDGGTGDDCKSSGNEDGDGGCGCRTAAAPHRSNANVVWIALALSLLARRSYRPRKAKDT